MRTRRLWDTGFEVLDFRTSARFRFKSYLEDPLLKALNHLNLQPLRERLKSITAIQIASFMSRASSYIDKIEQIPGVVS